jgi:hypothetical protein
MTVIVIRPDHGTMTVTVSMTVPMVMMTMVGSWIVIHGDTEA